MDVNTPMGRFPDPFDKEPFLANRRCNARFLVYTGRSEVDPEFRTVSVLDVKFPAEM